MPAKRFWFYNNQVERMMAEQDLRTLELLALSHSGEGIQKAFERLVAERGQIFVYQPIEKQLNLDDDSLDPEFNRDGLAALKAAHCRPSKAVNIDGTKVGQ
jgi:hypothetical protein